MKNQIVKVSKIMITLAILFISTVGALAQNSGEFPVPLSDPNKRGKLKAHINSGSITS